jgi:uncharacterized repeat protein (TIGR01451 family)
MRPAKALLLAAALASLLALAPAGASAAAKAALQLRLESHPTNFPPGGKGRYFAVITNVGAAPTAGPVTLTDTLPAGLTPVGASGFRMKCTPPAGQTVKCEGEEVLQPGAGITAEIAAQVSSLPDPSTLQDEVEASDGGVSAKAATTTTISATPAPFGLLGFNAPSLNEEGGAMTLVGAHPYTQATNLYLPTVEPGEGLITGSGHLRDVTVDLPRGMSADPAATKVLCTEAELIIESCPVAAAVGTASVAISAQALGVESGTLYNMVPTPGTPALLGFDVLGIFVHVRGELRSESDYGVSGTVKDALARSLNPVFGASVELWGDPTAAAHDHVRGKCLINGGSCPVTPPGQTAFLTLPTDCAGEALLFGSHVDSWEEPGVFREAQYGSSNLKEEPIAGLEGCGELKFEPTITARPTTNATDSPSGLDFDLHQPQDTNLKDEEEKEGRSSAALKDTTITFPAGMSVNAAQAGGLGACTEGQIGLLPGAGIHFSKQPQSCPSAAKLGSFEATSPLLVQRNEKHEVALDPETEEPQPEPLHGSIYIAKPFANPFGSLVAVYLALEDEKTGIVAKIAGKGELDPNTGQVTTSFTENPELPLEDIRAHLFGGARGAFVTPLACGKYTTSAQLTPWSAPEGKAVQAKDSFRLTAAAGGGACPATEAQAPFAPKLLAGTLAPQAGKYSPMSFRLSREDGSQRLGRIEATLPPGLSARLAGVAQCSEADIAKARSREAPNQGAAEQSDPSCPAASAIGTITAAAGAGPSPYYTTGEVYLAGPYKGAPLSVVAIAPAVAGPFDLGTVVNRSALYLDPETAQARAVSDPLPQILDGVPVDLRSVSLQLDRPSFTLNPTSCAEKSFGGQALSALGAIAPLAERFQVGGCASLPYGPKLSVHLSGPTRRGAHPRLRATFSAKAGEANTARLSFALPHSEFIDQSHFRTICTRVQFAAKQCPAGSVYGHMKAISPLLDYPLEGPIYLRSSNHELPDVVAALRGPPSQPLEFDLDGRVDSVNGGIRTSFEVVPDAPVSRAIVTLQGKKKGLFQNSTNICAKTFRATLLLDAQNGKTRDIHPPLKADCAKKGHAKKGSKRR